MAKLKKDGYCLQLTTVYWYSDTSEFWDRLTFNFYLPKHNKVGVITDNYDMYWYNRMCVQRWSKSSYVDLKIKSPK